MNTLLGKPQPNTLMPEFERVYPFSANLIKNQDDSTQKRFICADSNPKPHILTNPHQLSCGHLICQPCADNNIDKNFKEREIIICPLAECKHRTDKQGIFKDLFNSREINSIVVKCLVPKCDWQGAFQHYKEVHVYDCAQSTTYLKEKIAYLNERYEHNTKILHKSDTDSEVIKKKLEYTTQENQQLKEKISSQQQGIKALEDKLKNAQSENSSLSEVISILSEQQPAQASGHTGHTPNTKTKSKALKAPANYASKASPKAVTPPSASASATGGAGQILYSWKFDHTKHLNGADHADVIQKSEPFSINNHTFQLALVYHGEYFGLYIRVINGVNDAKAIWPINESITLVIKDNSKNKTDITKTLHLSTAPDECRRFPGESLLPLVGFKKFCRVSDLKAPSNQYQSCYLDSNSETTIYVVSAAQIKPADINSPYDVLEGSGLVCWPIRKYRERRESLAYKTFEAVSPSFYTSDNGYCFKLFLDTHGHSESNYTRALVYARLMPGKYDNTLPWPVSGQIYVSLRDRRIFENPNDQQDISTVITVNRKNRVVRDDAESRFKAETKYAEFFPFMKLQSDQTDPNKPIYIANDEIEIKAEFIPFE
ncbi:hypothetical protein [Endozoicomonas sp. SCSIO W0465]|uniref:hypothetical protein n=1 Tax=Endozoicomonas sp. SCSIO W0465 TaxID=2918516 RepID=UPI0020750426|nr:hypothetical protein [Endozoicomonas sp. SCSIO W0465]USE34854.1 hypothetical protein MJO57_22385 [Endozoicomonas sp. SCSIO W0465]